MLIIRTKFFIQCLSKSTSNSPIISMAKFISNPSSIKNNETKTISIV
ncbi:hypothetical protein F383_10450 [Gossypium arboreum]|uniref:Uncharacterized protein n=1 Tax=Gossypium arboreum TaxID=29729 RepID=A0A0B0NT36_GOSAR|nr:hypothetical protein F383_10450 [Gossypium arboreum]